MCFLIIDCVIKCFRYSTTKYLYEINFIVVTFVLVCCVRFVVVIIIIFLIVVNILNLRVEYRV